MPEGVSDGLNGGSLLHESHGERMPQHMCSEGGQVQSATANAVVQQIGNGGRFQGDDGSPHAHEQVTLRAFGASLTQLADQNVRRLVA